MAAIPEGRDDHEPANTHEAPTGRPARQRGVAWRVRVARRGMARAKARTSRRIRSGAAHLASFGQRALRLAFLYALLAAVSLAGGFAVVAIAAEYGYQPNRDTAAWAGRPPAYTAAGGCAACHEPEAARNAVAAHAAVNCQACHGPLEGHDGTEAAVAPGEAVAAGVELGPAREAGEPICLTCHEAAIGRPMDFPVVSSVTHFPLPTCTVCHDPHEPVTLAPPDIRHPLDRLPACGVCHRADGIRPMPAQHPAWNGDCRACHRSAQPLGT